MEVLARVLQQISPPPQTHQWTFPGPDRNMIQGTVLHDMGLLIELREAVKFQNPLALWVEDGAEGARTAADAAIASQAI